jgi:hypothetical protein
MRNGTKLTALLTALALMAGFGLAATTASAGPSITSAVINQRVFNDIPGSTLTTSNTYANPPNTGMISFLDEHVSAPGGFANRHNFRFSDNGATNAVFLNEDAFSIYADVTVSGSANIEAGLQVSPWWSENVDGVFAVLPNGEIAAFGGRLPFYTFNAQGVSYTKGDTVGLRITYDPRGLSMADPAAIKYDLTYGPNFYSSGWKLFDQGNAAEDPPHGLWGILSPAYTGGYAQIVNNPGNPDNFGRAVFNNVHYLPEPASLTLIALGGLTLLRRRSR